MEPLAQICTSTPSFGFHRLTEHPKARYEMRNRVEFKWVWSFDEAVIMRVADVVPLSDQGLKRGCD